MSEAKRWGLRPNVAAVIADGGGRVLLCRRRSTLHRDGAQLWQFPQGGIDRAESPEQALWRELAEELALERQMLRLVAVASEWFSYEVPVWRRNPLLPFRGQRQRWFLLQLRGGGDSDHLVRPTAVAKPEFDAWRWVSYWYPLHCIVDFKRTVYRAVLSDLCPAHNALCRTGHSSLPSATEALG